MEDAAVPAQHLAETDDVAAALHAWEDGRRPCARWMLSKACSVAAIKRQNRTMQDLTTTRPKVRTLRPAIP